MADRAVTSRTRLAPQQRADAIVQAAVAFFSEHGFSAQTRDLAAYVGVSQGLLFRYFPTKEALIERVYEEVFRNDWRPDPALLTATGQSLEQRLGAFYTDYARRIGRRDYTRLLLFAALDHVDFHKRLFGRIAAEIYPPVIRELRAAAGRPGIDQQAITKDEIEAVWDFHAGIFFLGIRQHVFGLEVPIVEEAVALRVRLFLSGIEGSWKGET